VTFEDGTVVPLRRLFQDRGNIAAAAAAERGLLNSSSPPVKLLLLGLAAVLVGLRLTMSPDGGGPRDGDGGGSGNDG